jgi:hypothetical protein
VIPSKSLTPVGRLAANFQIMGSLDGYVLIILVLCYTAMLTCCSAIQWHARSTGGARAAAKPPGQSETQSTCQCTAAAAAACPGPAGPYSDRRRHSRGPGTVTVTQGRGKSLRHVASELSRAWESDGCCKCHCCHNRFLGPGPAMPQYKCLNQVEWCACPASCSHVATAA